MKSQYKWLQYKKIYKRQWYYQFKNIFLNGVYCYTCFRSKNLSFLEKIQDISMKNSRWNKGDYKNYCWKQSIGTIYEVWYQPEGQIRTHN